MRKTAYIKFSLTLFVLFAMLSPTAMLAAGDDGKKHFKQGIKYEISEEWDKAAEEFALAITENPQNPEYRLHYRRSLFNASQMYMKRGTKLAEENDFAGAYLAFRKAYAYDPVNELAKSEMERMLRLQKGLKNGDVQINDDGTVKLIKTSINSPPPDDVVVPQKLEKLRDVPFPGGVDLKFLVKELAKDLDLNVLFETQSFRADRKIEIELKNVTAAKALDYIFLQENLFFQKVGPRTILVADQNQRQRFQQLVLRTFYLANASPKDVANVIKTAIPAQPGRTPTTVLTDDATNSITVRDTSENIALIGNLISSLDKDRAEVVMDVAIYEVSNKDLLQLGNQIGGADPISLGGTTRGVVGLGGNDNFGGTAASAAASIIPRAFGVGLVIPAVNLIAFQSKNNTKLIASTQIHAFNNEESTARIGQRVPVRTAQLLGFGNNTPGNTGTGGTVVNNPQAASVVNYEPTGLDLKFKPIVFPNQDVQVEMNIESKDVAEGGTFDNPIFTERTIKGTARIQNNKTLLLASVAQNTQSEGRSGLPLLGLIPIIGRLFTAPQKNNRQTDIVIAITPHVIRAPAILPEDEVERETGSLAVPTSGSLEAMIVQEERGEQLAAARRLGNKTVVQLPDRGIEEPAYVKSDSAQTNAVSENKADNNKQKTENPAENTVVSKQITAETKTAIPKIPDAQINLRPIGTSVKTLQIAPTVDSSETTVETKRTSLEIKPEPQAETVQPESPTAVLEFLPALPMMKKGERTKIAVIVKSAEAFRAAVLGLQFDNAQIAVRNVEFGDVFGADMARTQATPFLNQGGKCFVSLSSPKDTAQNSSGILAYIEIEALTDGQHQVSFNRDVLNMLTADGRNFVLQY